MACEPQQAVVNDLIAQWPAIYDALQLAINRTNTWMLQMDAAQAALQQCLNNTTPPNPPGP